MNSPRKKIALSAIVSTVNAWRHPLLQPEDLLNVDFYVRLAQTAEAGMLDMLFWGDMLGLNGVEERVIEHSVIGGLEPLTLLAALAGRTKHIGFVGTLSTTYIEPYQVARKFATLDHLSKGRIAWNIVTSLSAVEDYNFGNEQKLDQRGKYERTSEFIDVVNRLWNADGQAAPRSAQPVWFAEPQSLNVALPSPARPLLVQAGTSEAFREQAARTADAVFTAFSTLEQGQLFYSELKAKMAKYQRSPEMLKVMPGLCVIVGDTEAEARSKEAYLQSLVPPAAAISLLSARLGHDLSGYDIHGPLPDLPPSVTAASGDSSSMIAQLRKLAAEQKLSIYDLGKALASTRGHPTVTGTAQQIVDYMELWIDSRACDGFNLMLPYLPGGLDDFIRLVVPELQRRGRLRTAYESATLRGHLGLD